jgi:hypothetical protein
MDGLNYAFPAVLAYRQAWLRLHNYAHAGTEGFRAFVHRLYFVLSAKLL